MYFMQVNVCDLNLKEIFYICNLDCKLIKFDVYFQLMLCIVKYIKNNY